ncbi:MAG: hypothetical protein NTZ90_17040 [Proteobacteria bacterium]|nr:hypothetical protein [Pseudomonadota bacterium]
MVVVVAATGCAGAAMNAVFHGVSLLFFAVLVWLLLRAQRDHAFVLSLLQSQRHGAVRGRVAVAPPSIFMRRFASALRIRFEGHGPAHEAPVRMSSGLLTELFLQSGLSLIRCSSGQGTLSERLLIELQTVEPVTDPGLVERLQQALGGAAQVQLLPPGEQSQPGSLH